MLVARPFDRLPWLFGCRLIGGAPNEATIASLTKLKRLRHLVLQPTCLNVVQLMMEGTPAMTSPHTHNCWDWQCRCI